MPRRRATETPTPDDEAFAAGPATLEFEDAGTGEPQKVKPPADPVPPKKPRGRPARAKAGFTPENVQQGIVLTFDALAMWRGEHWKVSKDEIGPWSADAAKLLNESFPDLGAHVAKHVPLAMVAAGLGQLILPRVAMDVLIQRANQAAAPAPAAPADDPNAAQRQYVDPTQNGHVGPNLDDAVLSGFPVMG